MSKTMNFDQNKIKKLTKTFGPPEVLFKVTLEPIRSNAKKLWIAAFAPETYRGGANRNKTPKELRTQATHWYWELRLYLETSFLAP